MATTTASRYLIRCCYCKQTMAIESVVAPWNQPTGEALAIVERHGECCPKTMTRLAFRSYGREAVRAVAARDILTVDWKIETVTGRYNPAIKCGAKCLNAKHGDCECSCGGAHHGQGWAA